MNQSIATTKKKDKGGVTDILILGQIKNMWPDTATGIHLKK